MLEELHDENIVYFGNDQQYLLEQIEAGYKAQETLKNELNGWKSQLQQVEREIADQEIQHRENMKTVVEQSTQEQQKVKEEISVLASRLDELLAFKAQYVISTGRRLQSTSFPRATAETA